MMIPDFQKRVCLFFFAILICCGSIKLSAQSVPEIFELKIYRLKGKSQQDRVEAYLKNALIPAMHKAGIGRVGVFLPLETDSTYGKRVYVFTAYQNFDKYLKVLSGIDKDKDHLQNGKDYLEAGFDDAPYVRIQTILLKAFPGMTSSSAPKLNSPKSERIYELRSYESSTEKLYKSKVKMFNDGDEIGLFNRLGFNAVFYGEVLSGASMPNLMYMTSFANMASRDEHWKAFGADPQLVSLKGMDEYKNTVSKNTIYFLHPAEYSEY